MNDLDVLMCRVLLSYHGNPVFVLAEGPNGSFEKSSHSPTQLFGAIVVDAEEFDEVKNALSAGGGASNAPPRVGGGAMSTPLLVVDFFSRRSPPPAMFIVIFSPTLILKS